MILGLDIGSKRTGVAISAGEQAREYTTLNRPTDLAAAVAKICQQEGVTKIVIGLPVNEDGSFGSQAQYTAEMGEQIRAATGLPVVYESEFLTTVEVKRLLADSKTGRKLRTREPLDVLSAKLILEQYLSSSKRNL